MIGKYQRFEIIDECSCSRAVAPHDHAPHQGMKYYEISKRKSYGLRSFVVRLCGAASKRKASRITWSLHLGPRIATALMLSGLVSRELDAAERRQRWRALLPIDNWELRCSTLSEKKKGERKESAHLVCVSVALQETWIHNPWYNVWKCNVTLAGPCDRSELGRINQFIIS